MADKKQATAAYPEETYPQLEGAGREISGVILEQYRQSILAGDPLSLEWLTDSLADGEVKDLLDYSEVRRQNKADAEAAEEAAAIERAKPEVLGGEPQPEPVEEETVEE